MGSARAVRVVSAVRHVVIRYLLPSFNPPAVAFAAVIVLAVTTNCLCLFLLFPSAQPSFQLAYPGTAQLNLLLHTGMSTATTRGQEHNTAKRCDKLLEP